VTGVQTCALPISVQIVTHQSFEPDLLIGLLKSLVQQQEIYRIKGFVSVPNKAMRLVLQGVGQRFDSFYDRPWRPAELRQTRLVLIGHQLDQSQLEERVLSAAVEHRPVAR